MSSFGADTIPTTRNGGSCLSPPSREVGMQWHPGEPYTDKKAMGCVRATSILQLGSLAGSVSLVAIVILACLSPLILVVACLLICWLVPIVHSCRRIRVSVYMQITPKVKRQPRCGTFRVSMTSNRSFGIFFHVSVACTGFMGECAERAGKHEV